MVSPGCLLGVQDLSSRPRCAESESAFNKVSGWSVCMVKFGKPCLRRPGWSWGDGKDLSHFNSVTYKGLPSCLCAMGFRARRCRLLSWCPLCFGRIPWPCGAPVGIVKVLVIQPCLTLCNPMDCSPPGSSVHGIFQASILEWVAIPFSRGFSQLRDESRSPALQADSLLSEPSFSIQYYYEDLEECNNLAQTWGSVFVILLFFPRDTEDCPLWIG